MTRCCLMANNRLPSSEERDKMLLRWYCVLLTRHIYSSRDPRRELKTYTVCAFKGKSRAIRQQWLSLGSRWLSSLSWFSSGCCWLAQPMLFPEGVAVHCWRSWDSCLRCWEGWWVVRMTSVLRVVSWLHVVFFFFWALSLLPWFISSVQSSAPTRQTFPRWNFLCNSEQQSVGFLTLKGTREAQEGHSSEWWGSPLFVSEF